MPNYTFVNTETKEEETLTMTIAELEEFKKNNPNMKQKLIPVRIGDSVRLGITKHDGGFNDLLKEIKKKHPHNNLETR